MTTALFVMAVIAWTYVFVSDRNKKSYKKSYKKPYEELEKERNALMKSHGDPCRLCHYGFENRYELEPCRYSDVCDESWSKFKLEDE